MRLSEDAVLLRIFVGEDDMAGEDPLFEAIVRAAHEAGLAGATVLHAPMGFGLSRQVRSGLNPDAGARMPMVVEIVDVAERIEAFLPTLDTMVDSGLVTMEGIRAHFPERRTEPARPDAEGGQHGHSA